MTPFVASKTNDSVLHSLRQIVGTDAIASNGETPVTVLPDSDAECAMVLQEATARGWVTHLAGAQGWAHGDRPADVVISTQRLNHILEVKPDDLYATVEAGVPIPALHAALRESNTWIPLDQPGTSRTFGSVAATATAGPLQYGFGPVRDQILGMTVVTASGNRITVGGRVVKNVAGFDIPKLMIGGFGGFGLITQLHVRIRVRPERDVTLVVTGKPEQLLEGQKELVARDVPMASWEIRSSEPATSPDWLLVVRLIGPARAVDRHRQMLEDAFPERWDQLTDTGADELRAAGSARHTALPVTFRIGPTPSTRDIALRHLRETVGEGYTSVQAAPAGIRWSGATDADVIAALRTRLETVAAPLTVERAPWPILSAVGHFGSLRPGVDKLMQSLRSSFDPRMVLSSPFVVA